MKTYSVRQKNVLIISLVWLLIFLIVSLFNINFLQIQNIFCFATLILLPGYLTVLILKITGLEFTEVLGLSVGLSLLEIIGISLIGNTLLPIFGYMTPLSRNTLLTEFSVIVAILLIILRYGSKIYYYSIRRYLLSDYSSDIFLTFTPFIFVLMAIFGAVTLNNGGNGSITLIMLIAEVLYITVLIIKSNRVSPNVIPIALFFISLSLLLMTSLRGWYTTGHDIQREYRVFELAKITELWSIKIYRDAYNACMSITVLPTLFSKLLSISDPYVYKILFQIIFSVVPSILYLTIKRYVKSPIALLSVLYFISFPTFFTDMPMLNRQEIAFLFLSLMSYIVFEKYIPLINRQVLFTLFGIGLVLSHYSTTYTVIAILLFLIAARFFFVRFIGLLPKKAITLTKPNIGFWCVIILSATSFFWSSIITDTSSNSIVRVFSKTIIAINNTAKGETRSGDVLYSLFSWQQLDTNEELKNYQQEVGHTAYDNSITAIPEKTTALTLLGKKIQSVGVDVISFNYFIRQGSAKLLQLLVIFGFFLIVFNLRKRKVRQVNTDYILLATGSLVMVLSQIVLPILSVEYGVLRSFQQSLFFLSLFIVSGSQLIAFKFNYKVQITFASIVALIFFASSTGIFVQLLGGYPPQLHLNNAGTYFDLYYLHKNEIAGVDWIKNNRDPKFDIRADYFTAPKVESLSNINVLNDIYPALIKRGDYVYLGLTNTSKQQAGLSYNGNIIIITYTYPIKFLAETKNLVYNNGGSYTYK